MINESFVFVDTVEQNYGCNRLLPDRCHLTNKNREELTVILWWLFGQDLKRVTEFFKTDGKFTAQEETLPPHAFVKNEDEMDVDDDHLQIRLTSLRAEELDGYDVGAESQLY